MAKPILVIMAAGMGSRFGGLKQIEPVDDNGHIIMDFSLYDAKCAGFERVVFIIKKENEADFKEAIGNRIEEHMEVSYVFQNVKNLPEGFSVPEGRVKPWGTAHAVLSAAAEINGPFLVINADDFYGKDSFQKIFEYLIAHPDDDLYRYAMVGYALQNTVTENGSVARGICSVNKDSQLIDIVERTHIEKRNGQIEYTEDGENFIPISGDTYVSMNMWGFNESFIKELEKGFPGFLQIGLEENPLKCEYFLPAVVSELLEEKKATATVLPSEDKWYGITYKEDKPVIVEAIKKMKAEGKYPAKLWEA